jgi:hypothetical protein
MLVVRALKNRQLAGSESQVIYGTGHQFELSSLSQ